MKRIKMRKLNTTSQWVNHILNEIPNEELLNKARIIASVSFQEKMEDEGFNGGDLLSMYRAVALRFKREGFRIPSVMNGTSVNYLEISQHNVPLEDTSEVEVL